MIHLWHDILIILIATTLIAVLYLVKIRAVKKVIHKLEKQVEERTLELKQRYSEHYKTNQKTNKILKYVQEGIFILNDKCIIGNQYSNVLTDILDEKK